MICEVEGCENTAHPDKDGVCYKHAVAGVAVTFNGPVRGRNGWNVHTVGSFHQEHLGAANGRELARTRPNVERA